MGMGWNGQTEEREKTGQGGEYERSNTLGIEEITSEEFVSKNSN
jgi:hypothetical protein